MPIVYKATNTVNGKFYIGVTKKSLRQRELEHYSAAKNGSVLLFHRAIRKYGRNKFFFETIGVYLTYDAALLGEKDSIRNLKPSYNTADGGQGCSGVAWTFERRARTIERINASWTDERKLRMSLQNRGKRPSPQCYAAIDRDTNCREVICLNDGKLFKGVKYAAEHYGIRCKSISEVLSGRQTQTGGYSFAYYDDSIDAAKIATIALALESRRANNKERLKRGVDTLKRPVLLINTGDVFCSGREASRATGVHPSRINFICANGGKTRSGLTFSYADGVESWRTDLLEKRG